MTSLRSISCLLVVFFAATLTMTGCERTPEDLDKWIDAKSGMEKMEKWAKSGDETMPVRRKAVRILVKKGEGSRVRTVLEEVGDDARPQLLEEAVTQIEKQWETKDYPTLDEETKKEGGRLRYDGQSKAVGAVDLAYYVHPFAEGPTKEKLESILAEWVSKDWQLRDQIGNTTLGQLVPRSGPKGRRNIVNWLEQTDRPHEVTKRLMQHADKKLEGAIAKVLRKRAEEAHPKLPAELQNAVFQVRHEALVPYLEKAVNDRKSPPAMVDGSMELLKEIKGMSATSLFVRLVKERKGKVRWAAVNDLISLRGKAGISAAAIALPLEKETYAYPKDDSFKSDADWFANFVTTEMSENDVNTIANELVKMIDSDRWPAQVLALKTAMRVHDGAIKRYIVKDLAQTWNEDQGLSESDDKFIDTTEKPAKIGKALQKHEAVDKPINELRSEDRYTDLSLDKLDSYLLNPGRKDLVSAIESLTSSRESIPAWHEDQTVGQLADEVLETLGS